MAADLSGPSPLPASRDLDNPGLFPPQAAPADGAGRASPLQSFKEADGPSFHDVLDILNPLQHIPLVNTIYQHLTGDKEGAVADTVGGALWGGVIGLGAAVVNLCVEDATGKDIGGHMLALFVDDNAGTGGAGSTAVAANDAGPAAADSTAAGQTNQQGVATASPVTTAPLAPAKPLSITQVAQAAAPSAGAPQSSGPYLVFDGTGDGNKPLSLTPGGDSAATAPAATAATNAAPASDRPAGRQVGGFMVFGGGDAATAPAATQATAAPTPTPATAAIQQRPGGFMVFGDGAPAAAALPDQTAPAALPPAGASQQWGSRAAAATAGTATAAGSTSAGNDAAASDQAAVVSAGSQARMFAVPARRGAMTPRATLPLPTTGPGAVPGNLRAARMPAPMPPADASAAPAPAGTAQPNSAAATSAPVGNASTGNVSAGTASAAPSPVGDAWFVGAVNQAMDKYQQAGRLAGGQPGAAPASPGAAQ